MRAGVCDARAVRGGRCVALQTRRAGFMRCAVRGLVAGARCADWLHARGLFAGACSAMLLAMS